MTLLLAMVRSGVASGAERSRVALVRAGQGDALLAEATTRLEAELRALGFEVVLVDPTEGDARASVEAAHLSPPPIATLALSHEGPAAAADVWVADALTSKTSVRRIDVKDVSRERAPSVLAVRAVELLRASLLEAAARERAREERREEPEPESKATGPRRPVPLPSDVERFIAPDEPAADPGLRVDATRTSLRGELGVAALTSLSGSSPAFGPLLRIGYGSDRLSGRIGIIAPAFGAGVDGAAGSAKVRQETAVFELVTTLPPSSRFIAVLSAGAGVHHARVDGAARAPFTADGGDSWGFLGVAGAGAGVRLGRTSGLLFDVHALFRAPSLTVKIGDESFASRTPELAATAGIWEAF